MNFNLKTKSGQKDMDSTAVSGVKSNPWNINGSKLSTCTMFASEMSIGDWAVPVWHTPGHVSGDAWLENKVN